MNQLVKQGVSIRVTVVFVFILGILITASAAISLQYFFTTKIATDALTAYATSLSENTQSQVSRLHLKTKHAVEALARNAPLIRTSKINQDSITRLFSSILNNNQEFYAIYVGKVDGYFYEVINLEANASIRKTMGARLTDRYAQVLVTGEQGQRAKYIQFLNEELEPTHHRVEPTEYDPRDRVWYRNANAYSASKTKPYLFQNLQAPGQTYSMKVEDSDSVVGIDIALSTMSNFLAAQTDHNDLITGSEIYLFDGRGEVIASNQSTMKEQGRELAPLALTWEEREYLDRLGTLRVSNEKDWAPLDYSVSGDPRGYVVELTEMIAQTLGLSIEYVNGLSWAELVKHFHVKDIEILTPVYKTPSNQHWGHFSAPIITMPMVLATLDEAPNYHSLVELKGKTIAIPAGWSVIPEIKKAYPEVTILEVADVGAALSALQQQRADAVMESEIVLQYNIDIYFFSGIKILADFSISPVEFDGELNYVFHPEHQKLQGLFDRALAHLSQQDRDYLANKWLHISQELKLQHSTTVPYQQLVTIIKTPEQYGVLQRLELNGADKFVFVAPQINTEGQFFSMVLDVDQVLSPSRRNVYFSILATSGLVLLLLPFSWLLANPIVQPIRQLAVENEKIMLRQFDQVSPTPSVIKEIHELSESMVNMADAISHHQEQQQQLLDSFVETIAQAIDDKSPYTGGHCHRVPELGLMLAQVASENNNAYFSDFALDTDDKLREFKLAAWLHDCGKITTPECVVDKGSKLETLYNRIHEVRMRFEVLHRDAHIHYYQQLLQNPEAQQQFQGELELRLASLQDDFAFVAHANVGGEFMAEDKIVRLEKIAQTTWERYFDDRLGLSPFEELRVAKDKTGDLPVTESLLMDKQSHKMAWIRTPEYDEKFNIKLQPTPLQNNLGELYNLSIKKGTLNAEERFRINEHIISTIKILEGLPFPPELSNVARYASTHHETLIGTGYPRALQREDLSIGERILALSDIFEALTASDRPYKKAKTLSEALKIMTFMVKDEHLDKEIFNLFLRSGIYLRYAQQFLAEEQIDQVDIQQFIFTD